jgi:hypothetical protein
MRKKAFTSGCLPLLSVYSTLIFAENVWKFMCLSERFFSIRSTLDAESVMKVAVSTDVESLTMTGLVIFFVERQFENAMQ